LCAPIRRCSNALIFEPELFAQKLKSREAKALVYGVNAESFISSLVGSRLPTGCGGTCGEDSCGYTCGLRTCDHDTCASSCGITCRNSCVDTNKIARGFNPAQRFFP
jgi:hypothetical protein